MSTTRQLPATDPFGPMLMRVADEFTSTIDTPVWSLDDKRLDERFAQVKAVRAAADELAARLAGEMSARGHAQRLGAS